ncbi:hypothetical protein ACFFRR_005285 [Megaselia abdita]
MYELKKLDKALEKCQNLHGVLNDFLRHVQKLNIRYNYNEKKWTKIRNELKDVITWDPSCSHSCCVIPYNNNMQTRTSKELISSNMGINMKIIKIKRSLESMILEIQRSIKRHSNTHYPLIYISQSSDNKILVRHMYNY